MLNCPAMRVQSAAVRRVLGRQHADAVGRQLAVRHAVRFDSVQALLVAGLLFGIAHAMLKPILVILTLPITVLTLGLFLLVINALMLLLTAWLVPGFHLAGFWPARAGRHCSSRCSASALNLLFHRDRSGSADERGRPRRAWWQPGVLLPFAGAYFLSYLYRSVNAVIAPDLVARLRRSRLRSWAC